MNAGSPFCEKPPLRARKGAVATAAAATVAHREDRNSSDSGERGGARCVLRRRRGRGLGRRRQGGVAGGHPFRARPGGTALARAEEPAGGVHHLRRVPAGLASRPARPHRPRPLPQLRPAGARQLLVPERVHGLRLHRQGDPGDHDRALPARRTGGRRKRSSQQRLHDARPARVQDRRLRGGHRHLPPAALPGGREAEGHDTQQARQGTRGASRGVDAEDPLGPEDALLQAHAAAPRAVDLPALRPPAPAQGEGSRSRPGERDRVRRPGPGRGAAAAPPASGRVRRLPARPAAPADGGGGDLGRGARGDRRGPRLLVQGRGRQPPPDEPVEHPRDRAGAPVHQGPRPASRPHDPLLRAHGGHRPDDRRHPEHPPGL